MLILAARLWRDEFGNSWLIEPPLIQLLKSDNRKPYPLTEQEEGRLIKELPEHLREMVMFALHTGLRESELTQLKWSEENRELGCGEAGYLERCGIWWNLAGSGGIIGVGSHSG